MGRHRQDSCISVVEMGLEHLDPSLGDDRTPHAAKELLGFSAEHDAGDDLDPAAGLPMQGGSVNHGLRTPPGRGEELEGRGRRHWAGQAPAVYSRAAFMSTDRGAARRPCAGPRPRKCSEQGGPCDMVTRAASGGKAAEMRAQSAKRQGSMRVVA